MAAITHLPRHESPSPARPRLRLVVGGRRRPSRRTLLVRRALAVAVALVVLGALLGAGRAAAGLLADAGSAPTPTGAGTGPAEDVRVHVVQPGETYWSIAEGLDRQGDIRATVDALVAANGGPSLRAGDRIVLPD